MQAFFNVILADMRHETVLERLAISAIRANRIQDNFDVQDASEVELSNSFLKKWVKSGLTKSSGLFS
jgi:hypothetical protein